VTASAVFTAERTGGECIEIMLNVQFISMIFKLGCIERRYRNDVIGGGTRV
jgi:hypothetical protein